ncbi:MAG TPA: TerB family tellurite resistance protein [Rheinheimera sp.]|nr:TerB family tellurite resistance protein [Rheinheimera sp.]
MFQLFKTLLDKVNDGFTAPAGSSLQYGLNATELACVSLMLMVAHADFASSDEEQALATAYVKREFGLHDSDAAAVVALADKQASDAISLHQFTAQLKQLSYDARLTLLDSLWQQAYADGVLDPNEEAMLRKIADLLFIRHSDYIQAKLAVCGG